MKSRGGGGIVGTIIGGVISLVMLGGILAFFRLNNINSASSFVDFFRAETPAVKRCYEQRGKNCTAKIDEGNTSNSESSVNAPQANLLTDQQLGYSGPKPGQPFMPDSIKTTKDSMLKTVDGLKTISGKAKDKLKFNEKDWPHFVPSNRDCWSTQNEILVNEAVPNSVKLLDSYRKETSDKTTACSISSGKWIDTYTGKTIKNKNNVVLDYVVSLKYANENGGSKWTKEQKQAFANDEDNLSTVSKKSKDDREGKSPKDWKPENDNGQCVLAKKYIHVLSKYSLAISDKDRTVLSQEIMKCKK